MSEKEKLCQEPGIHALMVLVSDAIGCDSQKPENVLAWAEQLKATRICNEEKYREVKEVIREHFRRDRGMVHDYTEPSKEELLKFVIDAMRESSQNPANERLIEDVKVRASYALGYKWPFQHLEGVVDGIKELVDERNKLIVQLRAAHEDNDRLKARKSKKCQST